MLQSLKPVIALFVLICATALASWWTHPTLEEKVEKKCKKQAFRYITVTDMYRRELKVCKEITLERMRKSMSMKK